MAQSTFSTYYLDPCTINARLDSILAWLCGTVHTRRCLRSPNQKSPWDWCQEIWQKSRNWISWLFRVFFRIINSFHHQLLHLCFLLLVGLLLVSWLINKITRGRALGSEAFATGRIVGLRAKPSISHKVARATVLPVQPKLSLKFLYWGEPPRIFWKIYSPTTRSPELRQ